MQKVSKQSLAMIALSILLAISIALTFTFAALADKKTATGEITFIGNVALEFTGTAIEESGKITISNVDSDASSIQNALSNAKFKLSEASQQAYIKVTASVELGNHGAGAVTLTGNTVSDWKCDGTTVMTYNTKKLAANTPLALGYLFTAGVDTSKLVAGDDGSISKVTIKFVVEADTKADFTQASSLT